MEASGMEVLEINGVEKQFIPGELPSTLAELLEKLNIEANTIVAEVDGKVVKREKFGRTKLSNGQRVELIKFVGGG